MANPLARVMMDQMSKKSGKIKPKSYTAEVENKRNLDAREEAIITGIIHNSEDIQQGSSPTSTSNFRGKRIKLEDIATKDSKSKSEKDETSSKHQYESVEKESRSNVKDPYNKGVVNTSVIPNPGKGVSTVSLKSLGKK